MWSVTSTLFVAPPHQGTVPAKPLAIMASSTISTNFVATAQQFSAAADTTTAVYAFSTLDDASRALILSLLAGLSTCLGAAVVFCLRKYDSKQQNQQLDPKYLAFSLSLAASVMITVSVISILPESISSVTTPTEMGQRLFCFLIGCAVYAVLSKLLTALPEPDIILLSNTPLQEKVNAAETANIITSTSPTTTTKSSTTTSTNTSLKRSSSEARTLLRRTTAATASVDVESCSNETIRTEIDTAVATNKRQANDYANTDPKQQDLQRQHHHQQQQDDNDSSSDDDQVYNMDYKKLAAQKRAWRVTVLLFLSLAIHNFPEGLAVAASSLHSPALGGTTAVAIALHNIPEGIAIAIPCIAARPHQPWLAFWMASLSGLAEPLGAAVALLLLHNKNDSDVIAVLDMNNVLAFVAGIMMTVAILELFPEAMRQQRKDAIWPGLILGAVIMIASEAYLNR